MNDSLKNGSQTELDPPELVPSAAPASSRTWSKPIRKTIYTVNIGDYAPDICALTYPLIQAYANKIGANFHVIRERKFPGHSTHER